MSNTGIVVSSVGRSSSLINTMIGINILLTINAISIPFVPGNIQIYFYPTKE